MRSISNKQLEERWDECVQHMQDASDSGAACYICIDFQKGIERIGRSIGLNIPALRAKPLVTTEDTF